MRKTLALFLALMITLLSLYSLTFTAVNKEKDNVVISEKYIYGDKAYAENTDINFKAQYSENLLWDIKYDIATGETDADFSIYKDRIPREYEYDNELRLYSTFYYNHLDGKDSTPINRAYNELAKTATPYEMAIKVINLSDYYEYYPITIDVSFKNFNYDSSFNTPRQTAETELEKAISDFFRIPVDKNDKMQINLITDENGNITQTGTATATEDGIYDTFDFYAHSISTDDECFIYFGNKTEQGRIADTSEIPGGYGIYSLPYTNTGTNVIFTTEDIKNIFPLDESESVYKLQLSADKKELYMMSNIGNKNYLTVIDVENYTEKSKISVTDIKETSSNIDYIGEDFIVITHYHPYLDSKISVYTTDGKGGFDEKFTVDQYITDESEKDAVHYAGGDFYLNGNEIDVKWDGERLYVTNATGDNSPIIREGNFKLSIYDKNGVLFCGEYKTSLTTGYDGYQASGYYIGISNYDLIEIILS